MNLTAAEKVLTSTKVPEADQCQLERCSTETAPPEPAPLPVLRGLKASVSRKISASMLPLVTRFARDFVSGETIDDALSVAQRLANDTIPSTLGFWDTPDYTRRQVAHIYLAAVKHLAAGTLDSYVSIKPPALGYDAELASEFAAEAKESNIRLHCNSHGPESADPSRVMLQAMLRELPAANLGTTIPGRWLRSLTDADWAVEQQLNVRVVKGQWPGPDCPQRDLRTGFLEVVDRLAGRARHVAVATHDMPLAEQAIARLRAAGTSCELEQLYGMNSRQLLRWARKNQIKLRVYIPFGKGYVPNAIGVLKRNPRLAWVILKTLVVSR